MFEIQLREATRKYEEIAVVDEFQTKLMEFQTKLQTKLILVAYYLYGIKDVLPFFSIL